jgi:dihydroxyacetone kinase-like predicted kinase
MTAAQVLDEAALRRRLELAARALRQASPAIGALNVFPVPDSGRVIASGPDPVEAATAVIRTKCGPGTELVTALTGASCDRGLAALVTAGASQACPDADVVCYDGGMDSALLLISAE